MKKDAAGFGFNFHTHETIKKIKIVLDKKI